MYLVTIYNDGVANVIHAPGTSEVKVDDAQISREKSAFSSFSFDIFPGNPGWDDLTPFATTVKVTNTRTGKIDFDGRVIQIVPSMDDDGTISRSVTCEDCMGYLCDSHQLYAEEQHYSASGAKSGLQVYIEKLLTRHNATMPDEKKIYAGNITLKTFETSDGVTKSVSRGTTWDNIKEKLLDVFGGEMRVRRASDGRLYLDYAEHLGQTRATKIELTRNMVSSESEMDPGQVITRLYPYGSKITVTEEDPDTGEDVERETEDRIGIEDVNGGLPYIDDVVAIEQYGIIEGYQEWDDITQPQNLLNTAQEWLGANNAVPVTFTLDAVDLSLLGIDIDEFTIYDIYPCYNPLIGLDETLEIVKQVININEPEASTFDMGESAFRLSNDLTNSATKGDIQYIQSQIKTDITNVNNRVVMNQAYIAVMEDRIEQNVSQTITTTVNTAVSGIDVGSTNILRKTLDFTDEGLDTTNGGMRSGAAVQEEEYRGFTVRGSTNVPVNSSATVYAEYYLSEFKPGDVFTFSFYARGTASSLRAYFYGPSGYATARRIASSLDSTPSAAYNDGNTDFEIDDAWERYWVTWEVNSDGDASIPKYVLLRSDGNTVSGGTCFVCGLKLEKGTKATDWSPAPEDQTDYTDSSVGGVYDAVDDVNEALGTVQDGLQSANESLEDLNKTVVETITKMTNLEQTASGWDFEFSTIVETVTYLDNTMQTNFIETLKYIRFIDGEIWLGKEPEEGEEDFKVVISNERVRFLQNNIEVAYLSNKMLYITDAKITNRLEIGNFAFYPRPNGSLTLRLIN